MHFFSQERSTTFFSCRSQNAGRQRRFTVKIKQVKRSDMITFYVHTITEAKQSAWLGRAESGRWIFQPGHLTWRSAPWCIEPPLFIMSVVFVCLSVCQTISFESLDVGSSYLHIRYISREYWSSSYKKIIGSRPRSHEQKKSRLPIPDFIAITGSDHA